MPVKRRLGKARPYQITPETVELWRKLQAIERSGDADEWEPMGRKREYLDLSVSLDQALGVKLWEDGPAHVYRAEPPEWMGKEPDKVESWQRAWELRCELETATTGGVR